MTNALHLIAVLALSLGPFSSSIQPKPEEPALAAPDSGADQRAIVIVTNETGDPRQASGIDEAVEWALDRYQMAGMALPDLHIAFHRQRSDCGGFAGLHSGVEGEHHIDVCVGGDLKRRRALLHEMGHVWVYENLDDSDRRAFLDLRGLRSWNDGFVAWEQRGTEHAAMIISWGLSDGCQVPDDIAGDEPATLLTSFEHLTGMSPVCG